MGESAHVFDLTLAGFQQEVLERSRSTPVLLDFWATWCAPCRSLGPLLERLAVEFRGAFVLAKVDIDRVPELAEAFGVQSMPTVLLVKGGKVVDGFVGAEGEARVRELLARHVAAAADPFAEAAALETQGRRGEARARLERHLEQDPRAARARAELARLCALDGDDAAAGAWLAALAEDERGLDGARAAAALLELRRQQGDLGLLRAAAGREPQSVAAALALGRALLSRGEHDAALAELFRAAQLDLSFQAGEPRKALIEAFGVLGEESPLTREYRRRLSQLICS